MKKHSSVTWIQLFAVTLLFVFMTNGSHAELQSDDTPCEFPIPMGQCAEGRFPMKFETGTGPESFCTEGAYCIALKPHFPSLTELPIYPTPAFLHCNSWGGGHATCSVWPQGELHYSWAVSEGLETDHPPSWSGPTQNVTCTTNSQGGMVSVTITTPDQVSDTAFSSIGCGNQVIQ